MIHLKIVTVILSLSLVSSNQHVDSRCSCRCPEAELVDPDITPDWPGRKIYINSSVEAVDCDCEHVVVPLLDLNSDQEEKFCPRCVCKHETRSVTTIKVVVIIIIWVVSILLIYLVFLVCIDPLLGGRNGRPRTRAATTTPYRQHQDEDSINDDTAAVPPTPDGSALSMSQYNGTPRGVVNRIGVNQERWRRQVELQRSSVYDRHTMLN